VTVTDLTDALYKLARTGALDEFEWVALSADERSDVDEGLALQLDVLARWRASGARRAGWKVGLTSGGSRDGMGTGVRPFGFVLADRLIASGATITPWHGATIEPEICVVIGTDLRGADVTPQQARAALSAVAPAFEILTPRLPDGMSQVVRLGHDLNNWGIVVGPEHSPDVDLTTIRVTATADGVEAGSVVTGPELLDDPYVSLSRVCGRLAKQGEYLHAGDRVITGSLLPTAKAEPGSTWRAEFAPIGTVSVTFGAA
jgi:2-keto-4-pentenoate hydratase